MRPPLDRAELGDSWTFSLSTPGGQKRKCKRIKSKFPFVSDNQRLLLPGECWEVASEVMELDRLRLAVMLSWLWLVGG